MANDLERYARQVGLGVRYLLRVGAASVMASIDRDGGLVVAGLKTKEAATKPKHVSARLVIKRRHAVKLAGFAKLLGVEPQRFLDWQMDDLIEELGEVDGGCSVVNWAFDGLLVFDDAKEEARVKARVLRWQSTQRANKQEVASS